MDSFGPSPLMVHYLLRVEVFGIQAATKVETGLESSLCPQLSPDGSHVYILSYDSAVKSGAHFATGSLHRLSWPPSGLLLTSEDVFNALVNATCWPQIELMNSTHSLMWRLE